MNEEQLRIFLDVVELGSFQKVAERNYVSQRAVSRQIQRLEEHLGTQLFNRGKNKITLTHAGRFFEKRCRALLSMLNNTQHELHRFSYRGETKLSIGYFSPFDAVLVHELLNFLPHGVNTFVSGEGIEHLVSDVLMGSLDCAVILDNYGFNYDYAKMGLCAVPICQDEMNIGVSERLVENKKSPLNLRLFRDLPVAYYSNEDSTYLKQAFISSLENIIQPLEVLRVAPFEQLQMLVGTGQALSFYPERLGRILQKPTDHICYLSLDKGINQSCEFKLLYKKENKSPTLKQAIHYFKQEFDIEQLF